MGQAWSGYFADDFHIEFDDSIELESYDGGKSRWEICDLQAAISNF